MHTSKRISNRPKNSSRKYKSFRQLGLEYRKDVLKVFTKSLFAIYNKLAHLTIKHEIVDPTQSTLATIAGITREHTNVLIKRIEIHNHLITERRKLPWPYHDDSLVYTINPLFFKYKYFLVDLFPALRQCFSELGDLMETWKNLTHIKEYNNAISKVNNFHHSAWQMDSEYYDSSISLSSSSQSLFINPSSDSHQQVTVNEEPWQLDSPRTKDPELWQEAVNHFTKMLEDFENDWRQS